MKIVPDKYLLAFSSDYPSTHIPCKEIIETSLLDAHGYNAQMQQIGGRPNPLTGPFYIDGAEPGKTLVVEIHEIRPNRKQGWACKYIHPNLWPEPGVHSDRKKEYVDWEIDLENQTLNPDQAYFRGKAPKLPLEPVLGCIGVAPGAGLSIPSNECGRFGGNMDHPLIKSGTTLYLPIFVEGAYLFVGDGHALQGDGEVTGNGIEVSCDLKFFVDVSDSPCSWPYGENETIIFSICNNSSLEKCVRIATDEMMHLIMSRYQLSQDQAGILMGQLVCYQIGNFVNRQYSVACIISKQYLESN